ncbi:Transforming acidic coiled-coil-containing protein 2 [Mactra antiquata]
MGDNLMEFNDSVSEEKYVDDQDENDESCVPPKLVQSPVVVNSILKQSTKDNLIQLYTPVQKPEKGKLKVHFGADSLLETPNVKSGKKRVVDSRGIKFNDITESEISENVIVKEISTENIVSSNTSDIESKKETNPEKTVTNNTDNVETTMTRTDDNNDETAMDISICDTIPSNTCEDSNKEEFTCDILRQAELLLQTLGHGQTVNLSDTENNKGDPKQSENGTAWPAEETTKAVEDANQTKDVTDGLVMSTMENSTATGTNNTIEEEAMDFEEAMEVDDEIVFKIPSSSKVFIDNTAVSDNTEEPIKQLDESSKQEVKDTESEVPVKTDNNVSNIGLNINEPEVKNVEKVEEVLSTSLNGLVGCSNDAEVPEYVGKTVDAPTAECNEKINSNVKESTENISSEKLPSPNKEATSEKVTTNNADESSEEEFMSAGEEMETEDVKTPQKPAGEPIVDQPIESKEESPERNPPKVGYNLNFDDLEAMDPFSTKKSLMNSPDAMKSGTKENKTAPVVDNSSSPETEPVKSMDNESLKSETVSNSEVVPQSPKISNMPQPDILLSPSAALLDQVCQDKNAANIIDEAPDCLLQDNTDETRPEDPETNAREVEMNIDDIPLKGKQFDFATLTEADLEAMDPFKPKTQVCNTPDKVNPVSNVTKDEIKPVSNDAAVEVKPAHLDTFSEVKETPEDISAGINETNDETSQAPIKVEKVNDSTDLTEVASETASTDEVKSVAEENKVGEKVDEIKEIADTNNESNVEAQFDIQSVAMVTPIKDDTKSEVPKSPEIPLAKGAYNLDALDFDDMDPFKPKKQMMNSPCSKSEPAEVELDKDPFKPKKQIMNSPVQNTVKEPEKVESIEHEKTPEPVLEAPVNNKNDVSLNKEADKDTERVKLENDKPELVKSENISKMETSEEIVETQIKKVDGDKMTESKNTTSLEEKVSKQSDKKVDFGTVDPFADLNPFKSSSKIANSPDKKPEEPENSDTNGDNIFDANPFVTKSKICNSPEIKGDPFVTKSNIANSPVKSTDSKNDSKELLKTPPAVSHEAPDENNEDIFEVQGVTRRGDDNFTQMGQFGEIDDMQFVSASQVFNDPAAWEMLEKFGTTSNKEESSLSRMSLYVKFDPLVDAAPINPRRVSIRYSQLEKVKEYGVDDTFLLLGTPPSKRRQSVTSSRGNAPAVSLFGKSEETKSSNPATVDLFFAASPTGKEQKVEEKIMGQEGDDEFMSLMDRVGRSSENENLFQELKYTDADFEKFKTELKLVFQGNLMNKEREWCAKIKALEDEKSKLVQMIQNEKKEKNELVQVMLLHEQTIEEVTAQKEEERKKKEEIKTERDQAMEDIQEIESAFSILNTRFEKSKNVIQSLMKNNETIKVHTTEIQGKLKQQNEKYHALEKSSETKNAENTKTIEKLTNQVKSLQEKCNTQQQLMQMKLDRLEKEIQSKTSENKELTEICDNLMAKLDMPNK